MKKTFEYEDIEQILAEADDLLQQIDPEVIKYLKEEQRARKNSSLRFRTRSGRKDHQRAGLIARECTRRWMIL